MRLVRSYTVQVIGIALAVITLGRSAKITSIHGAMGCLVKVRIRFHELQEKGVEGEELIYETIRYGVKVGLIEWAAEMLGAGAVKGIVSDFMKSKVGMGLIKDLVSLFWKFIGYESMKLEDKQSDDSKNNDRR